MTSKKQARNALIASVTSLVLCFAMLIGTTFAWFTDIAETGMNQIVAGNLDVALWDANGNSIESKTDLFTKPELWEPGAVAYAQFYVVNSGNLNLKYTVSVNHKDINNIDGHVLSEVLSYAIFSEPFTLTGDASADRQAILAAVKENPSSMIDLDANKGIYDELQANASGAAKSDLYTVVLYWEPNNDGVDNLYNVNNNKQTSNGKPLQIDLGIKVAATQLEGELDSFGPNYDEDAAFGSYVELTAGADLMAALASAEAGKPLTIKLLGDVEWPTEGHHGENDITPASSIVINGNGYTITTTGAGVTPLGDTEAPMTLKNVKIVDNSVSYDEGAWELSYLEMGGKVLNCVNVDFADPIMIESETATFTDCSFVGHYDKISTSTTQYGVWVINGDATFTNCSISGTRGMKICDQYASEVGTVVIDGCTFNGISEKPGIAIDDEDTQDMDITIKNSTFINCKAGDQGLYIYETDNTVPTVENNKVYNNAVSVSSASELLAYSATALTQNNGVAEEATVILTADIDMEGADFSAMIAQRGDKLTIVGNGHKISNVNVISGAGDNTTGQASMFYAFPNSTLTVSDLTLENITVTAEANATGYAAAVVGYCEGTAILNNVDVVNATVIGVKSSGLLVGHLSGTIVAEDCDIAGTVTLADFAEEANGHYAGKYIGTLAGAATLTDCTVSATVSGNLNAANDGAIYGRKTAAGSLN